MNFESLRPYTEASANYIIKYTDLNNFVDFLLSTNLPDSFAKLWADPIQGIHSLRMYPFSLETISSTGIEELSTVLIGGFATEIQGKKINRFFNPHFLMAEFARYDLQTFNNFLDYEPYTTYEIYLPFIGIKPISVNEILASSSKKFYVYYDIDLNTGEVEATITDSQDLPIYIFNGTIGIDIPLGSVNNNYIKQNNLFKSIGAAFSSPTGLINPMQFVSSAINSAVDAISNPFSTINKSNSNSSFIFLDRQPYIILYKRVINSIEPQSYAKLYGKPSMKTSKLNEQFGFTVVNSCHLENFSTITKDEKEELMDILKNGIILEDSNYLQLDAPVISKFEDKGISFTNNLNAYEYNVYANGIFINKNLYEQTIDNNIVYIIFYDTALPSNSNLIQVEAIAKQGTIFTNSNLSNVIEIKQGVLLGVVTNSAVGEKYPKISINAIEWITLNEANRFTNVTTFQIWNDVNVDNGYEPVSHIYSTDGKINTTIYGKGTSDLINVTENPTLIYIDITQQVAPPTYTLTFNGNAGMSLPMYEDLENFMTIYTYVGGMESSQTLDANGFLNFMSQQHTINYVTKFKFNVKENYTYSFSYTGSTNPILPRTAEVITSETLYELQSNLSLNSYDIATIKQTATVAFQSIVSEESDITQAQITILGVNRQPTYLDFDYISVQEEVGTFDFAMDFSYDIVRSIELPIGTILYPATYYFDANRITYDSPIQITSNQNTSFTFHYFKYIV